MREFAPEGKGLGARAASGDENSAGRRLCRLPHRNDPIHRRELPAGRAHGAALHPRIRQPLVNLADLIRDVHPRVSARAALAVNRKTNSAHGHTAVMVVKRPTGGGARQSDTRFPQSGRERDWGPTPASVILRTLRNASGPDVHQPRRLRSGGFAVTARMRFAVNDRICREQSFSSAQSSPNREA